MKRPGGERSHSYSEYGISEPDRDREVEICSAELTCQVSKS